MILLCLDFEASGTDPRGYPIEIAIADVATGKTLEWLIAPTPAWLESGVWEAEAEAVHGIARAEIIAHGRSVNDVTAELTAHTRGAQVLSDAPSFDTKWLHDLYRATGAEPPFVLRDFHQFAWLEALHRARRADIAIVKAETEAYALFPQQHRAGPDARRNAEILRQIQGLCMKRYRLDPENPPQLTPEEARRLDETPIDYSDSPLFGEDWIAALLLAMVIEHCASFSPEKRRRMTSYLMPDPSPGDWLDSYNIPANAEAMRELDGSEIEIIEQDGAHIIAKVTPEGRALLDRLRAEQQKNRAPS